MILITLEDGRAAGINAEDIEKVLPLCSGKPGCSITLFSDARAARMPITSQERVEDIVRRINDVLAEREKQT